MVFAGKCICLIDFNRLIASVVQRAEAFLARKE
jgi:hypothetical protein